MKKITIKLISIVLTIIIMLFIWHNFLTSGNTIIYIMIVCACYLFIKKVIEKEYKRKFTISMIIAIIFSIIEIICNSINKDYTLNGLFNRWNILNFIGYIILIWICISFAYDFMSNCNLNIKKLKKLEERNILTESNFSFGINIILLLIAWIPYFLTYYPGILTADSCVQIEQALGLRNLTNHHPILHTGIISIFINFGIKVIKNINTGVSFYTLFQMISMAIMFSIVLRYLSQRDVPYIIRLGSLLYYMFYPINALFSVIMWKDVLFSGIIPIYIILSLELIYNPKEYLESSKKIILFIIISLLVMFLRNNGPYIVILLIPFVFILLKRQWKKLIILFSTLILLFCVVRTTFFFIFNVENDSSIEILSIPIQQIARVKKYHKDEINIETISQINNFFLCEDIEEKYNPIISDPVKSELNYEYYSYNKLEFFKLWLKLLKKYYKDYIESFISNSYGYYYPEAKHWVANRTIETNNIGIIQTPLIIGKITSKVDSLIEKRNIPIISMLFSIGMAFWIIIILFGYELLKKNYKIFIAYNIIFILWLTIVASPVFCEFRYAYPMFTSIPIFIGFNNCNSTIKKDIKN